MKYIKGTFVVVPNQPAMVAKPSEMQIIYLWLCSFADKNGVCFPARRTLAHNSGCNIKTVDKYLKQLVDDGFIEVKNRRIRGQKENLSNSYQLLLIDGGSTENGATPLPKTVPPSTENGAGTISNELYLPNSNTNGSAEGDKKKEEKPPYSFPSELTKLSESPRHDLKVIALYWSRKGVVFHNEDQFKVGLKRELRAASLLKGYSGSQVAQAIDYCKKNYEVWTLETVGKRIMDLVNKK